MRPHRSAERLSPADVVTIMNAVFGFLAVALLVREWGRHPYELTHTIQLKELKLACGAIVLGALCDVADGLVARATWTSRLGNELDIMADAITFGAAPAVLIVVAGFAFPSPFDGLALAAATTHVVAVVVRLARHAVAPHAPSEGFVGITSPLGGIGVIAVLALGLGPAATVVALFVVSALMLAPVRYPHQTHPAVVPVVIGFVCCFVAALAGAVSFRLAGGAGLVAAVLMPVTARVAEAAWRQYGPPRRAGVGLASSDK
jgi:CDP-diacylglycerol--serine O-phosphatidyltransferase